MARLHAENVHLIHKENWLQYNIKPNAKPIKQNWLFAQYFVEWDKLFRCFQDQALSKLERIEETDKALDRRKQRIVVQLVKNTGQRSACLRWEHEETGPSTNVLKVLENLTYFLTDITSFALILISS